MHLNMDEDDEGVEGRARALLRAQREQEEEEEEEEDDDDETGHFQGQAADGGFGSTHSPRRVGGDFGGHGVVGRDAYDTYSPSSEQGARFDGPLRSPAAVRVEVDAQEERGRPMGSPAGSQRVPTPRGQRRRGDWVEQVDPTTKVIYFWNTATNETQWDPPDAFVSPNQGAAASPVERWRQRAAASPRTGAYD